MVYRWCFMPDSQAVVYRYQFPLGITPIGFDNRRLADGRKLKSFQLAPIDPAADEAQVMRAKAPAWTRCAQWRNRPPKPHLDPAPRRAQSATAQFAHGRPT